MDFLSKLLAFVDGKKTYIAFGVLAVAGAAFALGYIDQSVLNKIVAIFGPIAGIGLAHKIAKVGN